MFSFVNAETKESNKDYLKSAEFKVDSLRQLGADSLNFLTQTAQDKDKVLILTALSKYYDDTNPVKSLDLAIKAKELAEILGYDEAILILLKDIRRKYIINRIYHRIPDYTNKIIELHKKNDEHLFEINEYIGLFDLYWKLGDYSNVEKTLDQMAKKCKLYNINDMDYHIDHMYGNLYSRQEKYEDAINSYKKALKDYKGFKKSIPYEEDTEEYKKLFRYEQIMSHSLNNIGDIYRKLGKEDEALYYLEESLKIAKKWDWASTLAVLYINLSDIYKFKHELDKALEFQLKSQELIKEHNFYHYLHDNYLKLYGLYNALNQFDSARVYDNRIEKLMTYKQQTDSVKFFSQFESQHQLERWEQKNEILSLKLEKEKNIRYITFSLFTIIIITTMYLFSMKLKQKKIKVLSLEEGKVKARLHSLQAKINPHFIFNALNSVATLVSIDTQSAEKMIENLSILLRYTLVSTKKDFVSLQEEIEIIKKYLEIEKIRFDKRLNFKIDIPKNSDYINIPPLIIQPLVENSIKHGISTKINGGSIIIKCEIEEDFLNIAVTDDGEGESSTNYEKNKTNGFGIEYIKERLDIMYGNTAKFDIIVEGGYTVKIKLPLKSKRVLV